MTELPDDMEAVVERMEANLRGHDAVFAMRTGKAFEMLDVYAEDLRALLLAYQERGRALRKAAEYLCRLEGALLADDLDMRLNFPDDPSPTAMAERILPGFSSVEYDLARHALNQKGKSHD